MGNCPRYLPITVWGTRGDVEKKAEFLLCTLNVGQPGANDKLFREADSFSPGFASYIFHSYSLYINFFSIC